MLVVNNTPILVSVYDIMCALKRELTINNVNLLKDIIPPKYSGQDVKITCPYHKDGHENKPSSAITSIEVKRGDNIVPAGTWHCFACGKTHDITELISHCLGYDTDMGSHGAEWILSNFSDFSVENRDGLFKKFKTTKTDDIKYVTEEELDSYAFTHPYMYKRKLTDKIIDLFDIGYDANFILKEGCSKIPCITFPVRDINGNCLFIARRSIKGKIFNYPELVDKPIYSLYELQRFKGYEDVYICESIINALTIWGYGKFAVALNGTGTPRQYRDLINMSNRHFIIATDNDEAGIKGRNKLIKALKDYKLLSYIQIEEEGKDINDISKEEFLSLEEHLC